MATTPKRKIYKAAYLSSLDYLDEVREFVRSIIEPLDFDDEQLTQVILSVDEAFTNAVKHAYKNSTSGRIDIKVAINQNNLKISIIDYGRGFDP
ncbi:MAG: ATP-binding protein, partial [Calditrichia bacterium]|nr:ATP-binding protein [Calditrichia bacterium]